MSDSSEEHFLATSLKASAANHCLCFSNATLITLSACIKLFNSVSAQKCILSSDQKGWVSITINQNTTHELYFHQLGVDTANPMANDTIYQIQQQLNVLKKTTQECGLEIEKTRQMQEHHSINFYKHHQISGETCSKIFSAHFHYSPFSKCCLAC